MGRESGEGTVAASVLAVLVVTGTISLLYLPLILQ